MNEEYRYLFPFEKVIPGSKVVLYGAGEIGQAYLRQICISHYCEVIVMADKNYQKYPQMVVPVINPDYIYKYQFDYVIIALRVAVAYNEMHRILKKQGIPDKKIVCIYERNPDKAICLTGIQMPGNIKRIMDNKHVITIACLVVGGLGDHIIQKRFLMEVMKIVPEVKIHLYAIRHISYLQYLFSDCSQICSVNEDLGMRYGQDKESYMLSMTLEACHYIRVDFFDEEAVNRIKPKFARKIRQLITEIDREPITILTPVHVSIMRRLYRGDNVYSGFGYHGIFNISDKKVNIPVSDKGENYYQSLCLKKYITVNYGSGECMDGSKVAKMWPIDRFSQTISLVKQTYPYIKVVQLGNAEADKIIGADIYILGEKLEIVASVLKHAIFHLDIEGGLVHMATQLGTKCVVLFGPTLETYYGYDVNINIHKGKCKGCFGMYSDINRCAKEMEKPECMYSITPEMVMKYIKDYMEDTNEV